MDDFILYIEPLINGKPWRVFLQIPHNKNSHVIAEALAYGGLWPLFADKAESMHCEQVKMRNFQNFWGLITIKGITTQSGELINELGLYVQIPKLKDGKEPEVLLAMCERGLGYYLGATVKRVWVKKVSETIPEALENERIVLA